ncbi:sulfite exporter TauE/SafE family protein [Leptothrix discophora]|uniref:Probable membrane transporter protein n=1 Tax=Leptothrix discophora TaxID=89 RepID=A0ABT9G9A8_LEPDI|nr:sulfite exporter TauE/SafE family protein [Leptothrix discophora]MDP4302942.1 sulfite exporter TauE/SafE family protein [Leptothrix discophora]
MTDALLLLCAAFGAGVLNAIAGGGSFLTFPALVWTGVPPIAANATSAVAVSPGYLGSALGFRAELAALPRSLLWREGLICSAGGVAGALLLLVTPAKVFSALVPWLLLFATVVFAVGPRLMTGWRSRTGANGPAAASPTAWPRTLGLLLVSVYGGYFNGGLGILLMALYTLAGEARIHTANALKNLNSLLLSLLSVAAFAWAGAVHWPQALLMMVAATAGGFGGARIARRLPAAWVRGIVIVTGVVMSIAFFLR